MSSKFNRIPERTTTFMIWGIPCSLKKQFKTACAKCGLSMKEIIERAMNRFITETKRKGK